MKIRKDAKSIKIMPAKNGLIVHRGYGGDVEVSVYTSLEQLYSFLKNTYAVNEGIVRDEVYGGGS